MLISLCQIHKQTGTTPIKSRPKKFTNLLNMPKHEMKSDYDFLKFANAVNIKFTVVFDTTGNAGQVIVLRFFQPRDFVDSLAETMDG